MERRKAERSEDAVAQKSGLTQVTISRLESGDFLRGLIDEREIIIETVKGRRGKYGRYLTEIWIGQDGVWSNLNDALVVASHAVYQDRLLPMGSG